MFIVWMASVFLRSILASTDILSVVMALHERRGSGRRQCVMRIKLLILKTHCELIKGGGSSK